MRVCIIIPAYNECQTIGKVVSEIKKQGFEIMVIDDGSSDNTASIAANFGVKVLKNASNKGKGASLISGFKFALENNFEAVITMDGDGQHLAQEITQFIRAASNFKNGIVIGNRMLRVGKMPIIRILTNKFMSWLISAIAGQDIPDTQCGFRLIKSEVLKSLNLSTSYFETESEILIRAARLGFKIDSIPITTVYSGYKSKINPIMDAFRFLRFIIKELWITIY